MTKQGAQNGTPGLTFGLVMVPGEMTDLLLVFLAG
jgi:hypothetical protein